MAQIRRENGKKGGRPRGRKNDETLKREAVLKAIQQRVMRIADNLLDARITLALGQTFLYKVEKYYETVTDDKGKTRKILKAKPPKLVESEVEIRDYLESEIRKSNGEINMTESDDDFYFITAKEPNDGAIERLLSRTFGNSVQPVSLTDEDGKSVFGKEEEQKSDKAIAHYFKRRKK